eukprot:1957287-Rhodomonas_salina.2
MEGVLTLRVAGRSLRSKTLPWSRTSRSAPVVAGSAAVYGCSAAVDGVSAAVCGCDAAMYDDSALC